MAGGGGGGSQTTTNKIDPWLKDQTEQNIAAWKDLQANNPYPNTSQYAPVDQSQQYQQAVQGLGNMAQNNSWLNQVNTASQGFQNAQGYTPQQVQAQDAQVGQLNMDQFQNPYTDQVVDRTLADLDRQRQRAVNQGQDSSIAAGAFNGSRSALADAATNREYADASANAAAQLRQQGYNTSLSAAQNQQAMQTQNNQFNSSQGLQAGMANQGADLTGQRIGLAGSQGMLQAGQLGNNIQQGNYQNALNSAGSQMDYLNSQQQYGLQQALAQWQAPIQYQQYITQALGGAPSGGTSTTSQSGGGYNRTTGVLGGAATGASIGSSFGPWGTAIGAGAGGLAGLFG